MAQLVGEHRAQLARTQAFHQTRRQQQDRAQQPNHPGFQQSGDERTSTLIGRSSGTLERRAART